MVSGRAGVDVGQGPLLVLIPGIQGRWEWMGPAIRALSRHFRVLSFSLNQVGPDRFFDRCVDHLDALLDQAGDARPAVVAGVSFGGLVAVRYAARRPMRTRSLVLTSSPAPRWRPDPVSAGYTRRPRLSLPAFAVRAVRRSAPEIAAAFPTWPGRCRFAATHITRVLRSPLRPTQMASWVHAWLEADLVSDCRAIRVPTLVVTGEPALDRVVPVSSSLEYLQLIAGARYAPLARTGHLGLVTRPEAYAAILAGFVFDAQP